MTDHHDIAGFENLFRPIETAVGTEWRPQLYINMLNRLRLLDCEEDPTSSNGERVAIQHSQLCYISSDVCHRCAKKSLANKQESIMG